LIQVPTIPSVQEAALDKHIETARFENPCDFSDQRREIADLEV
jgi:hypothetical protein